MNPKIYKEIIINLTLLLVGLYLPFAFIINKYNPLGWEWYERCLYVIAVVSTIGYASSVYNKK
jgi:hypothetical protein